MTHAHHHFLKKTKDQIFDPKDPKKLLPIVMQLIAN
jgi:hypothetical protein